MVIPSYARPDRLACCLGSLARLTYDRDRFEVIVVDDGSPQPIADIAAAFRPQLDVTVIRQDNAGPATARNTGARTAKYEFLAFTDDDCTPQPQWLEAFATHFVDTPHALLGGMTVNALTDNRYAGASQSIVDFLYDYYGAAQGAAPFFTSNNMAVLKRKFLAVDGFDETFPLAAAEDREFGIRWRRRVGPLLLVPEAIVEHAHALTLRRFWRQHANYGRGARHLAALMRSRERRRVEPARFYRGLVMHPLQRRRTAAAAVESGLIALSQFAMVWGYVDERRREKRQRATRPAQSA